MTIVLRKGRRTPASYTGAEARGASRGPGPPSPRHFKFFHWIIKC